MRISIRGNRMVLAVLSGVVICGAGCEQETGQGDTTKPPESCHDGGDAACSTKQFCGADGLCTSRLPDGSEGCDRDRMCVSENCVDTTCCPSGCEACNGPTCLYECGDEASDPGEECDEGPDNGKPCTPPAGQSCTYCDANCQWATMTAAPHPSCSEGPVTETCLCGGVLVSDDYCCSGQITDVPCQTYPCTHFVRNAGDDDADGTSHQTAWATIRKVNEEWALGTLGPDTILCFRQGDLFADETLTPAASGTAGHPIIVTSYDTGDMPILSGFTTLSAWTQEGNGVYSAPVPEAELQTNMVTVDGMPVGMGRYPDTGEVLTYEAHSGTTSITDEGIGDTPNWTGAELVVNKNDWTLDRCQITNHTGDVFTYTNLGSAQAPEDGRYYFIQNDLRCVTTTDEWYHGTSAGKLYVHGDPSSKEVKVATRRYLVENNGFDHITFDGLELTGAVVDGVYSQNGDSISVKNCRVSFAGRSGVYVDGGTSVEIDNNVIRQCGAGGIHGIASGFTATRNQISSIGIIPGQSTIYHPNGIYLTADTTSTNLLQYNTISQCGYNGIQLSSITKCDIKNNLITDVMRVLDDGGGIYLGGGAGFVRTIDHNIILDSGANAPADVSIARGIYIDSTASDCVVTNNTVAHSREAGIQIHSGSNTTITGNTCFNNHQQIMFQKIATPIAGTILAGNTFVAKKDTQLALLFYSSDEEIRSFGASSDNVFARPVDDDDVFRLSSGYKTLAGWKALLGNNEAGSTGSPHPAASEEELHFIYNETMSNKTFTLSSPMVDMGGASHAGTVSLDPWTSLVLMGVGTIEPIAQGR